MKKRKYKTEFCIAYDSWDRFMFSIADYKNIAKQASVDSLKRINDCKIYMIGKRPRIFYYPESLKKSENYFEFSCHCKWKGKTHDFNDKIYWKELGLSHNEYDVQMSKYPHNNLELYKNNGEFFDVIRASLNALAIENSPSWLKDLEILYIGKGGDEGKDRSALDRINSHSKLQEILVNLNANDPDSEAFVIFWNFAPPKLLLHVGGLKDKGIAGEENKVRIEKIIKEKVSSSIKVSLIEAALISYFKPEYNYLLKESFPSPTIKILNELIEKDILELRVYLDTTHLGVKLFSSNTPPNSGHEIIIDLNFDETRKSFSSLISK
jgi:hypothetical protein